MSTIDSQPEAAIPILLLKTKSTPNDGYEEQFSSRSPPQFEPTFVPVLEHKLLDKGLNVVRDLLENKHIGKHGGAKYGGMIFTSQRAVEAFVKLVEEGKGDNEWPHLHNIPIYTVGPATSRALQSIPQNPPLNIFGAEMGNGEALAHFILDHYAEWYKTRRIKPSLLFLVGETRRDIIPKILMNPLLSDDRKIQVNELEVYGTGVMESFEQNFTNLLEETKLRNPRWVVVFSPTGCEAMLRSLNLLDPNTGTAIIRDIKDKDHTLIATIGPTTREFLENTFGFKPHVCAAKPSPKGVEEAITRYMSNGA